MGIMSNPLLPFGLGFVGSVVGTLLVRAMFLRLTWVAMGLELLAGLLGIWAWQLWAKTDHSSKVLIAELVGSVLGTGLALKYGL